MLRGIEHSTRQCRSCCGVQGRSAARVRPTSRRRVHLALARSGWAGRCPTHAAHLSGPVAWGRGRGRGRGSSPSPLAAAAFMVLRYYGFTVVSGPPHCGPSCPGGPATAGHGSGRSGRIAFTLVPVALLKETRRRPATSGRGVALIASRTLLRALRPTASAREEVPKGSPNFPILMLF